MGKEDCVIGSGRVGPTKGVEYGGYGSDIMGLAERNLPNSIIY